MEIICPEQRLLLTFFKKLSFWGTLFSNLNTFLKILSIGTCGNLFQNPIFCTPGVHLDLKTCIFRAEGQNVVTDLLSTMWGLHCIMHVGLAIWTLFRCFWNTEQIETQKTNSIYSIWWCHKPKSSWNNCLLGFFVTSN